MSKRQITMKPTCMGEVLAFPANRSATLRAKLDMLVTDPFPDGNSKKKLRGTEDICRLRVGDHRVFYRFGEDWVSLLGIRRRNEGTYRKIPEGEDFASLPPDHDDDLDELVAQDCPATFSFENSTMETPLPIEITKDWLRAQNIPASAFPVLLRCKTDEQLLEAQVDGKVHARVLDAIFPPSLDAVVQEPDLVVPSTQHLDRYRDGDLLGFLLRLDDDQARLIQWALRGPTMVRGGAGTGKSTVALYRVKEVLDRGGASNGETVLFTTYTRALMAVTRQLLGEILSQEQMSRVRVATVDQIAREIVSTRRKVGSIESDRKAIARLKGVRSSFVPSATSAFDAKLRQRALARLSDRYILEEFDWIIEGRNFESLDEYKIAPRPGRGVAFPDRLRESVWELREEFSQRSGERFPALRNEALTVVRDGKWTGHWDYVFVDEAQDLSPSALALMAEVAHGPEGLFFTSDLKQTLYSRSYTWSSVHPRLQFKGRTATLRRNYRSTRQIDHAAFSVLRPELDEKLEVSRCTREGPLPVLVRGTDTNCEADWIVRFVRQMARYLHLRQNVAAVLVPSRVVGEYLAQALTEAGLFAKFSAGRDLDLSTDFVKVITLFSAKGLEFPIVVVAGLHEGTYPVARDFADPELFAERMRHERRLLYVGLTRAMRGLMLVVPDSCQHEALLELHSDDWHVEDVK